MLFETGYGPSGLPHIGTFGEVVRTTMVRQAFQRLSDIPTKLFAFSDDMDGLRKVPTNVPNQEMLAEASSGMPLTMVPDPFGTHESFGHHNNAMLRGFLDGFGFDYEFQSSTDWYMSGRFDKGLLERAAATTTQIMEIMLPSLREERRADLFALPAGLRRRPARCCRCQGGGADADAGTIVYRGRGRQHGRDTRSPAGAASCNGSPTGRCAGCAGRRLRDVGQGPHPLGRAGQQDLPRAGLAAAGRLQLRAVPGRQGPEDLEVQGQRPRRSRNG